jgi:microcystin-dependent protein
MPFHTHSAGASALRGASGTAEGNVPAEPRDGVLYQTDNTTNLVDMAAEAVPTVGGSQAHNNLQPLLVINYIIALTGLYPSRS